MVRRPGSFLAQFLVESPLGSGVSPDEEWVATPLRGAQDDGSVPGVALFALATTTEEDVWLAQMGSGEANKP